MAGKERRRQPVVLEQSEVEIEAQARGGTLDIQPLDPLQPLDPGIETGPGRPPRDDRGVPGTLMAELMISAIIIAAHGAVLSPLFEIRGCVSVGDFFFPFPRAVYAAILRVEQFAGWKGVSFSAVKAEVERLDGSKFEKHFETLYQLLRFGEADRWVGASHALEVRNRARLRRILETCSWAEGYCWEGREAVFVVQDQQRRLADLLQAWSEPGPPHQATPNEVEQQAKEACARKDFQA